VPPAGVAAGPMTEVRNPGYVRIRARFDRAGAYLWHCHILFHEDDAMMRPFMVMPAGQGN